MRGVWGEAQAGEALGSYPCFCHFTPAAHQPVLGAAPLVTGWPQRVESHALGGCFLQRKQPWAVSD